MNHRAVVVDVETSKVPRHRPFIAGSFLVSIHATDVETNESRSWLFPSHPEASLKTPLELGKEITEYLKQFTLLANHNLKFDLHWLDHASVVYDHLILFDTQTAEYLISGQRVKMSSLNDLCTYYKIPQKFDKVKQMWDAGFETNEIPADILVPYGEQDTKITGQVYLKQLPQLLEAGLWPLFQIQMHAMLMYKSAEANGIRPNLDLLKEKSSEFAQEIKRLDESILALSGNEIFNLSSPAQKSAMFFGGTIKHKMPTVEYSPEKYPDTVLSQGPKWTVIERKVKGMGFAVPDSAKMGKTGCYSVDSTALAMLHVKSAAQRKVLKMISERNRASKIRSTYLEGLQKRIQADGLIHTTYKQSWTNTGRGSSEDPNNQNMPRDKTGPVKACFMTRFP
jgi:DNA polymerase-1